MAEQVKICKISLCDPPVETNIDDVFGNGIRPDDPNIIKDSNGDFFSDDKNIRTGSSVSFDEISSPRYFIVEFGCDFPVINVNVGDTIENGQILGYINEKKVISEISGTILEKQDKYIIGKYNEEDNSEKIMSQIENL